MRRFRFRLERVLRHREIIEENKKRDVGFALNHYEHQKDVFQHIENAIILHEKRIEQDKQGKLYPRDVRNELDYARWLDKKITAQRALVEKAEHTLAIKRSELIEARKKRKILEKVRNHHYEAYENVMSVEEQKQFDEISTLRKHDR
jgi:flagellar protein FliJ